MIIGIPKETKTWELRVALVPEHVRVLVELGHKVCVEKGAGADCWFSDGDYEKAGAVIANDVYGCEMIVRVKEPPLNVIGSNQIIMGYLHIGKGQNPVLLKKLLDQHVTSYAYEEIRNENNDRVVNLGVEAGIVGMYEGLRLYGKVLNEHGFENRFKALGPIGKHSAVEDIFTALKAANIPDGIDVYVMGKGMVSRGVQKVLRYGSIRPRVLCRKRTTRIKEFLPEADIIVNAIDWYPWEPRIIKKEMLKMMKETAVIIDISCDANGAIESCIPTSWESPTYVFNGITHFCVDNLPGVIPKDTSIRLSSMIIDHVIKAANNEELSTGLMTKDGVFEYEVRQKSS